MLFESGALAVAGGLAGVAGAWPLSRLISNAAQLPFVFERGAAAAALATACALNFGFAVLPSRGAARVHPTEALRYE